MNSKKKIREFVLLEKSTPRKKNRKIISIYSNTQYFTPLTIVEGAVKIL